MKKLERLKLSQLSKSSLEKKQQSVLIGGCGCACGGCACVSWDGSGLIPVGRETSDHGNGSVSLNLSGTVSAGI